MTTIFSKIINREVPAQFVYEDDTCVVIMDKFPVVVGQSMVISKREVAYLFDLPDGEYAHLLSIAKRVALASDRAFKALRTCLVVEGFEVPHSHIKIYPMKDTSQNLVKIISNKVENSDEELAVQADKLKLAFQETETADQ